MSEAQQRFPGNGVSEFSKPHPDSYFLLSGEVEFTTYGGAIGIPVFWVKNRVKLVPLVGFFWKDFVEGGVDGNPALGVKFLYFFNRRAYRHALNNSFYAGLGGFANTIFFLGRETTDRSVAGVILGYNYTFSRFIKLAPELHIGANEDGMFGITAGLVLHFGY